MRKTAYGISGFLILCLLFADQFSKQMMVKLIKEKPPIILIKGFLKLDYLENRGISFGMLEGQTGLFLVFCILFLMGAIYFIRRLPVTSYYIPLWGCAVFMIAGAMGNFADRAIHGYVIDFIEVDLFHFPIFNVADILVVCGGIVLAVLMIFRYSEEDLTFLKFRREK